MEFCGFMHLSVVSFFSVFLCPLVCCISVGNFLAYTCLFLRDNWSVFSVCAVCPADDDDDEVMLNVLRCQLTY